MKAYASPAEAKSYVAVHGEALAQRLAHYCASSGKRVMALLEEHNALRSTVDLDGIFQVILSLRATIELEAVERRFGTAVRDSMQRAMDRYYNSVGVCRGPFETWVHAAEETMRASNDPAEWLRIHAVNLLDTRDPEDELLHLSLAEGFAYGDSLVDIIAANA